MQIEYTDIIEMICNFLSTYVVYKVLCTHEKTFWTFGQTSKSSKGRIEDRKKYKGENKLFFDVQIDRLYIHFCIAST